jgi:DNA-binding IclR family transcriptional regulator
MKFQNKSPRILGRMVKLIDLLAESERPITLKEANAQLKINKPSLMRLLKSMKEENLASQADGFEGYMLGPKVFFWAGSYLRNLNLLMISQNRMRKLRDECNESVVLSMVRGLSRIVLAGEFPSREVLSNFEMGVSIPLPYGAGGKAITAFLEPNLLEELLSKPIQPLSKTTVCTPEAIKAERRRIRKSFLAVSRGERSLEIWAMASPIFNHANQVIGSLAIVCPSYRFQAMKGHQKSLINLARDISFEMGSSVRFP